MDLAKQQAAALPKKGLSRSARENLELYAIMFPTVVLIIIFMYVPLYRSEEHTSEPSHM